MLLKFKTDLADNIHADSVPNSWTVHQAPSILERGTDFTGTAIGEVGGGVKPIVSTPTLPAFNADTYCLPLF